MPENTENTIEDGVLRLKSSPKKEEERETLAYLDDYELTIPKKFSAAFALRYVRMAARHGIDSASDYILEESLGTEGYEHLLGFEDLEAEQLAQLMNIIQRKVLGAMDVPKDRKLKSV